MFVGESFIRSGGGGESTSNSGDTEQDLDANRDCEELLDRDFVHESLQLDIISDSGDVF